MRNGIDSTDSDQASNAGHAARRREGGFALSSVLLVLVLLLSLAAATTFHTSLDLKSTSHFDTGNSAFFAAEAGVMHGLSSMNSIGVTRFKHDIVDRWATVFGLSTKTMPSNSKISYQVTVAADVTDPNDLGTLSVTGFAPLQAQRSIVVGLARGGFVGSPGAIYLAADTVNAQFSGNAFEVNGNDHDPSGSLVPGGVSKPGISAHTDSVTDEVVNSLNDAQKDNVKGLGFSTDPLTPSVLNTGGPDVYDLERIVENILSAPGVVTTSQNSFNGGDTFGTLESPQITHMTDADVRLNGNASGAGILIADGSVTINGSLDFVGWIIVRGHTIINVTGDEDDDTVVLGNATIMGSLWTGHLAIQVGGSAIVDYCQACLELADNAEGIDGALPRPMRVVSWQELL
jgi:hypothetical protein